MGEAWFSISKIEPPECGQIDCFRPATFEVSLIGSTVAHEEVCRFHKAGAKKRLVERHVAQQSERERRHATSAPGSPEADRDG